MEAIVRPSRPRPLCDSSDSEKLVKFNVAGERVGVRYAQLLLEPETPGVEKKLITDTVTLRLRGAPPVGALTRWVPIRRRMPPTTAGPIIRLPDKASTRAPAQDQLLLHRHLSRASHAISPSGGESR